MKIKSSRSNLLASVVWNLVGFAVPLAFGLYAIPILISGYGNEKFGFLTITWAVVGYFSIFDLGLGRALTKQVAEKIGRSDEGEIPGLVSTALVCVSLLGAIAGALIFLGAPFFAGRILHLSGDFKAEAVTALVILGFTLPLVVLSAALVGLLEAYKKFRDLSFVKIFLGIANFGGPLLILMWTNSLVWATISLAAARLFSTFFYFIVVISSGIFELKFLFQKKYLRSLAGFGIWISISNIVSPLMAQLDKVVVGSLVTLSLLPFYSVPSDIVNRLTFVPLAFCGVIFPYLATAAGAGKSPLNIYQYSSKAMICIAFAIGSILLVFSGELMRLWLGADFARNSELIVKWLAIGFMFNCIARIPTTLLQATGRPDLTAKLHLLELPIYALILFFSLKLYGVLGAAIAWSSRMLVDTAFLFLVTAYTHPTLKKVTVNIFGYMLTAVLLVLGFQFIPSVAKEICVGLFVIASVCFGVYFLRRIDSSEKKLPAGN